MLMFVLLMLNHVVNVTKENHYSLCKERSCKDHCKLFASPNDLVFPQTDLKVWVILAGICTRIFQYFKLATTTK